MWYRHQVSGHVVDFKPKCHCKSVTKHLKIVSLALVEITVITGKPAMF